MVQRSRARYSLTGAASRRGEGHLPKPVYEALPIIYLLVAGLLLYLVESPLIFLSSALFGAAGVGVLLMRLMGRRGR